LKPIDQLLTKVAQVGASDLHISVDNPPIVRMQGELRKLNSPPLDAKKTDILIQGLLSDSQKKEFEENWDIDFCYELPGIGRFRTNVLKQRKGNDAVFRFIPTTIPEPGALGIPEVISNLCKAHHGLVLVTGPTRSGKTTTLASLINEINMREPHHIITIEDPIEFVFPKAKALINQREVKTHTGSTAAALRAALREDPDVIMVGEMRDLETIQLAISAAETGHLVISTLQTQSAHKTIDRILDSFPASRVSQIRTMLSESIRGVLSQKLVKGADGKGMVLAAEVLLGTLPLANLIRDGKTFQIPSVMQTGAAQGMRNIDAALATLVKEGKITKEEAMKFVDSKTAFEQNVMRKDVGQARQAVQRA
jgi:twitching motility protein PilT